MATTSRIGAIDFWRGLVLIVILVDHIPGNWLENATPRNFGLSDSAEAFIFLSGLSVGAIYVPRARKNGLGSTVLGCLKRALKLYGAHIAMTVAALLMFGVVSRLSGLDELLSAHGRALVFAHPALGASAIAMLSHQIGYFNILPLYIALMIWAPVAVAMTLAGPRWALAVSALVYCGARAFGLNLPNWPEPGSWFFNPLAWQWLFTLGVVAAQAYREAPPKLTGPRFAFSAIAIVVGALLVTDAFGLAPGLRTAAWSRLDIGKQDLGLARLAHFCALAYLVAATPALTKLAQTRFGLGLQRLGRHSLAVFALGSLLSAIGQAAMSVCAVQFPGVIVNGLGMIYTLAAIAASFALACRLDWEKFSASTHVLPARSRWLVSPQGPSSSAA